MLVVVRIHARIDLGAPAVQVFARIAGVRIEDAGEFDFKLDGAVLVEDPVDAVLIIGGREDL